MKKKKKNGIVWLEFEQLTQFPEIIQAVFWNLPLGERDDPSHPLKALHLLGLTKGVKLTQCHQDRILVVEDVAGLAHYSHYDAMITNQKGIGLLIRHADCQAAVFYDPIQKVLGNVHCGWRGSVHGIYRKMIQKMVQEFGSNPKDITVSIGPSLGPNRAEFKHYEEELPEEFWSHQIRDNYFDFWAISKQQLLDEGIEKENLEIAGICTFEEGYSYRKDRETPHHGTIVALSN